MTDESRQGSRGPARVVPLGLASVLFAGALLVGVALGILLYGPSPQNERNFAEFEDPNLATAPGPADPGTLHKAQFGTETLYPEFMPGQRRYVTRCRAGGVEVWVNAFDGATVQVEGNRPAAGEFQVEARPVLGQDFRIEVDGAGSRLDGSYSVRCLPAGFPDWSYERFRAPPRGIFTVAFRPWPTYLNDSWMIAFDQDGLPRWWKTTNVNALWAEVLPGGRLVWGRGFGDGFGQDERTGIELTDLTGRSNRLVTTVGTPNDSHEYVALPNGNSLVMSYRPRFGVDLTEYGLGPDEGVLDGEIQEVTPGGKVVWRWNSGEEIGLEQTPERWWEKIARNPHADAAGRDRYDVFHLNSIQPIGRDLLLISARHADAVFAISRRTGEVVWKFGGTPTEESLTLTGPDFRIDDPLSGGHDARLEDGVLSIHDNGTLTGYPPRLVRYRIDPRAGTARFLSQIDPPEEVTYSHCCGSARSFGAGWLVSWGDSRVVAGYQANGRLAFELGLAAPSYRAVPVPESVEPGIFERALDASEDAPGRPGRAIEEIGRLPSSEDGDGSG